MKGKREGGREGGPVHRSGRASFDTSSNRRRLGEASDEASLERLLKDGWTRLQKRRLLYAFARTAGRGFRRGVSCMPLQGRLGEASRALEFRAAGAAAASAGAAAGGVI